MNSHLRQHVLHAWLFSTLAVLIGGCDSGDGESLGGVDGSKQLAALDADEYARVCDAAQKRAMGKAAQRGGCLIAATVAVQLGSAFASDAGVSDSDLEAACDQAFQECLAQASDDDRSCRRIAPNCKATLAEYDRCLSLSLQVLGEVGKLDCSSIDSIQSGAIEMFPHAEEAQACSEMINGCFVDEEEFGDAGLVSSAVDGGL